MAHIDLCPNVNLLFTYAGALSAMPMAAAVTPLRSKDANGKRKMPVPNAYTIGSHSPSGTMAASTAGFAQEKRVCRPVSLQKVPPDMHLSNQLCFSG